MWDLIVSVPDHCLSFYFVIETELRHCTVRVKKLGNFNPTPIDQYRISGLVYHIYFFLTNCNEFVEIM